MFMVFRAKRILSILCLTIVAISGIIIAGSRTLVPVFFPSDESIEGRYYIIDAGHGGEDGGAVSSGGIIESDLNLEIAQQLNRVLSFAGVDTVMTRSNNQALYSDHAKTLREKKRSDLQNRVQLINQYPDGVLLSIHQNSMPSAPYVHGAQVFYNAVPAADRYANQVQYSLNTAVNPKNNAKEAKPIESGIYLMKNVQCPAILIECGFLSNTEETDALQDPAYQQKLALAIAAGILNDTNGVYTE